MARLKAVHADGESRISDSWMPLNLQTTLLGSEKKGTLLSTVIARLTPSSTRTWPAFQGTMKADSLVLGPVTLENLVADLKVSSATAEITSVDAGLLGGQVHLTGKVENGDKPAYSLEGDFQKSEVRSSCASCCS